LVSFVHSHARRRADEPYLLAGQTPWGKRLSRNGSVVRDKYEENVVAVVRHMRANGYTLLEIVSLLRDAGVVGRRGTPIGMTRVFEMIHGGRSKPRRKRDRRKSA
jgi:hypothetical protein